MAGTEAKAGSGRAATEEPGSLIQYRAEQGVAILTLNDPPANTYSYEMMRQLDRAILEARMDESVQVMEDPLPAVQPWSAGDDASMRRW